MLVIKKNSLVLVVLVVLVLATTTILCAAAAATGNLEEEQRVKRGGTWDYYNRPGWDAPPPSNAPRPVYVEPMIKCSCFCGKKNKHILFFK
jgi:hypothetical protein